LILAAPWIIYQLWAFISAGLYPKERRLVHHFVPAFVVLFAGGAAFFLFVVSVPTIKGLLWFDNLVEGHTVITIQNQIDFMGNLMLVFGLAFQIPLAILILARVGLVSMKGINKYRRHVIMGILIFGAVMGPGDVLSSTALALPMWLLYEAGALLAYFLVLKKKVVSD
jgi:sec-independent protein translocase protein TatC